MNKEEINKEFDEKLKEFNFHHKDLVCFNDAVAIQSIKSFYDYKRQEIKKEQIEKTRDILQGNEGNFLSGNRIKVIIKAIENKEEIMKRIFLLTTLNAKR